MGGTSSMKYERICVHELGEEIKMELRFTNIQFFRQQLMLHVLENCPKKTKQRLYQHFEGMVLFLCMYDIHECEYV
jgi:hypothetical protein